MYRPFIGVSIVCACPICPIKSYQVLSVHLQNSGSLAEPDHQSQTEVSAESP